MSEVMQGAFETTMGNLQKMLQWSSAPFDLETHDQLYLNLAEDEMRTIANAGESVIAYCTYKHPYVQDIELDDSVDGDAGMEGIIRVPLFEDYLEFVGGDDIRVEFYGEEGGKLAKKARIIGDLTAEIQIPCNDNDYQSKALKIVNRWNEDDEYVKASNGEVPPTRFTTRAEEFQKIVEVTDFDDIILSNYPVVVEDGEFVLDAVDENQRHTISGSLHAEDVEGPDVNNTYSRGFPDLFHSISGNLDVMIEQDAPINIVRQSNDRAMTLRYNILPTA